MAVSPTSSRVVLSRESGFDVLALAGDGLFSSTTAGAAGIHPSVLRRAVSQGRVVRLRRGWYALATSRRTPEGWHELRLRAELASRCPGLIATHDSALVVLGLPVRRDRLDAVHLGRIDAGPTSRRSPRDSSPGAGAGCPTCVVHRVPPSAQHDRQCVEPGFAVVQLGLDAGPGEALVAADAALRRELISATDLSRAVTAYRRTPGIAQVRRAVEWADGRAQSPGESRLRFVLLSLGYRVELQAEVSAEGHTYRADLRINGSRVLVEYDGLGKYDDPSELRRERSREAALRCDSWEFARFGAGDLDTPELVKRRVDAALRRVSGAPS
ncbi:MAG: type IV toxin-antitoxin system AbiEi family antitoxin domain-containing protein [Kineosporiaceae bacterium]|nr:type IV toxin-antitoxin system AbiEi family antitoxin domain-containing protein [Kineosporiaceae bacterium]